MIRACNAAIPAASAVCSGMHSPVNRATKEPDLPARAPQKCKICCVAH